MNLRSQLVIFLILFLSSMLTFAQQNCANFYSPENQLQETSRFSSPRSFIEGLLPFLKQSPSLDDVIFAGPKLSLAQFKALSRFSAKVNKPLQKGDRITIVRPEDMLSEARTEIGYQKILKNEKFEDELLRLSEIENRPREILSFRLHLMDGTIVETPIFIKGKVASVNFDKGTSKLYDFLNGNATNIKIIEVAHTHPTYAVRVESANGTSRFRANEISRGDYEAAISFAQRFPFGKILRIKAVLPNGFYYQLDIPTGRLR